MPSFWPDTTARCRATRAIRRRRIFTLAIGPDDLPRAGSRSCPLTAGSRSICTCRSARSSAGTAAATPRSRGAIGRSANISISCWRAGSGRRCAGRPAPGQRTSISAAARRPCCRPTICAAWASSCASASRSRRTRRSRSRSTRGARARNGRGARRDRRQPREPRRAGRQPGGAARDQSLAAVRA